MQGLIDLAKNKSGFTENRQIMLNRYMNFSSDWNGDGLIDLIIPVGGDPEVGSFASLLMQKKIDGNISFEFNENYSVFIPGDSGQIHRGVSDFNNDGLLDLVYHTQNYHGRDGNQPDFYIDGCPWNTHEKLFINNGNGFEMFEIDDTFQNGSDGKCPLNRYNSTAFDIDKDGVDEILASSYWTKENTTHTNNTQETFIIRYYDINDAQNGEIYDLNFVFSTENINDLSYPQNMFNSNLVHERDNKMFVPVFSRKYQYKDHIGFVGDDYWENNGYQSSENIWEVAPTFNSLEIYNFNIEDEIDFKTFSSVKIFDGIDPDHQDYVIADDWSIHVENLDTDEAYEYILLFMENHTYKQAHVRVFDHDGTDMTDKWIGWSTYLDEYNIDSSKDFDYDIDSNNLNYDQSFNHANGIHVVDIDNDGDVDIVPQNGWYFNSTGDLSNRDYTYFIFINNGEKFFPTQVVFPDNHKNSSGFFETGGYFKGFKIPVDLDSDGYFEIVQMRSFYNGNSDDINYDIIELFYDSDDDGVLDSQDQCLDTPSGAKVDVTGCQIFELPVNNYKVEVSSATCIGNSDGVIDLSVEDASFDYTVTITGKDNVTITGTNKTGSVTGLAKGTYEVCFTVDGQANYEQCFEVVVGEPPALTAFIDIDNDNRSTSIQMTGSKKYNVTINGLKKTVTGNSFEANLSTGLSIIRVDTDLECQGFVEKEVFISEDVHYYPNPTNNDVKVHVGGEDTRVKVSVFSEKGDLIYTRYQDIADVSRKTNIDLVNQIPGTYIVILESKTVRETFN